MRNQIAIVLTGIAASLTFAGAAQADTSTYNKYTNSQQYNGYSETTVNAHVNSSSVQKTVEQSTKIESIAE